MVVLHRDAQVLARLLSPEEQPRAQLRIRHSKLQLLMGIGTLVIEKERGNGLVWGGCVEPRRKHQPAAAAVDVERPVEVRAEPVRPPTRLVRQTPEAVVVDRSG